MKNEIYFRPGVSKQCQTVVLEVLATLPVGFRGIKPKVPKGEFPFFEANLELNRRTREVNLIPLKKFDTWVVSPDGEFNNDNQWMEYLLSRDPYCRLDCYYKFTSGFPALSFEITRQKRSNFDYTICIPATTLFDLKGNQLFPAYDSSKGPFS